MASSGTSTPGASKSRPMPTFGKGNIDHAGTMVQLLRSSRGSFQYNGPLEQKINTTVESKQDGGQTEEENRKPGFDEDKTVKYCSD